MGQLTLHFSKYFNNDLWHQGMFALIKTLLVWEAGAKHGIPQYQSLSGFIILLNFNALVVSIWKVVILIRKGFVGHHKMKCILHSEVASLYCVNPESSVIFEL